MSDIESLVAYRGRIEYPFVIWVVGEGLLNYLDGTGDVGLSQVDDFDRHGGWVRGCSGSM